MTLERTRLGNIRVVATIGRGGMGDVHLGFDERLQRKVALKSIRADWRLDAAAQARFQREARILSQLDHPHICRVHDYLSAPEADVLVLEFIEGRPLTALLDAALPRVQKQRIAEQIAQALVAAHERGVIHRDLKPGNVMVTPSGDVKVVDFGLAMSPVGGTASSSEPAPHRAPGPHPAPLRTAGEDAPTVVESPGSPATDPGDAPTVVAPDEAATQPDDGRGGGELDSSTGAEGDGPPAWRFRTLAGQVLGTPLYMSPEQARGEPLTPASDLFAFGLLLQQLFTGVAPHPAGLSARQILTRVAAGEVLPPGRASRPLLTLIRRLKAPSPLARPTAVDALEQLRAIRELPRRRAVRGLVIAVLAGLVAAGVKYTLDVREARDRANRHRARAEDLVGFMIGDLREKLEPLGQLPLLGGAGDKALAYFDSLSPDEVTDEDRFRKAEAMMQVGQVRFAEGKSVEAGQLFHQSLGLLHELTRHAPDRLPWQAALGAARFWVGYLHWREGRLDEALAEFQAYLDVAAFLVSREPDSSRWQMELALARNNLGAVSEAKGDYPTALGHFGEAVAIKQRLVDRDPATARWREELADSQSWLGDALLRSGDLPGASVQFRAGRENLDRLNQLNPDHRDWQSMRAVAHDKTGDANRWMGRLDIAVSEYEAARDILLGLTAHDPTNLDWKRNLGAVLAGLAQTHLGRSDGPRATAALDPALSLLKGVLEADPGNADFRRQLAGVQALRSRAQEIDGHLADALRLAEDAAATLDPIRRNADRPTQQRVAEAALARARALFRLDRAGEAAEAVQSALMAITSIGADSRDTDVLAMRAEVLWRAGRPDEAAPLLAELERRGFVPPELAALRSLPASR